jgi:hypothetical protein
MLVFDKGWDPHFKIHSTYSADWIPTDGEAKEMVMHMADMSPTFLSWLRGVLSNWGPQKLHEFL